MKQETTGWQWHQLDHMRIICTSLQTSHQHLMAQFLQEGRSSWHLTNSVKVVKAYLRFCLINSILILFTPRNRLAYWSIAKCRSPLSSPNELLMFGIHCLLMLTSRHCPGSRNLSYKSISRSSLSVMSNE